MDFRLLGPVEVWAGDDRLPLGGPKPRTLLAHLVLQLDRVVPAERLIDAVWDDQPPRAARNTLQSYVSHLRRHLGPERLERRAGGYRLRGESGEADLHRFEQLLEDARAAADDDPAGAVRTYRRALAQWRGPALDDLRDRPSLQGEIARLEELRLAAVEERLRTELDLGRHAEVVAELERLTDRHPLRESLWAHLVVALYRSGRQADALAAHRRARETLADELGIDPSPDLQRLQEQVLRQDPGLDVSGTPLRGYRLLQQVGAGASGVVHRAFHPPTGREVAIKAVHRSLANDPGFIRRFEAEAQRVARLEHPHLVPLDDYWREPDRAYLVMRYLRGGSLRGALASGPLAPAAALSVVEQIGQALDAAHRQGVVHRRIKPENILLDEAGNAYLADFGVARVVAGADGADRPATRGCYAAPEAACGEPLTAQADVYGLGLVARELLTGAPGRDGRALPPAADAVLARATATRPADRHRDVSKLVRALRDALADGHPDATAGVPTRNPYKGLRAFEEADAEDFHGRDELIARLTTRLSGDAHRDGARFLAVVGPSGSGKSSLVRAGLVPALRRGAVAGSERWFAIDMLPGTDPFAELRAALLRVAARPLPQDLASELSGDPSGLARVADWVLPDGETELLVVVDQFEEVFTRVADKATRSAFLDSLVAAASDPAHRLRVVLTLRADFYDRPLRHPGLAELVRAHAETLVPLSAEELERAVVGPAERVGARVEPGLVVRLASDASERPGALPLVQYVLTELFDHCEGGTLTLAAYSEIGGVSGALTRRAEEVVASLEPAAAAAVRQLLLRLITLGEGTEDTRRRVSRSEVEALPTEAGAMQAAIAALGRGRLLSFDRDPVTRAPTIEVAHEALIREWPRLHAWVDSVRDDLRTQRRLTQAANDWVEAGRDPSFLASGSRLEQLEALDGHDILPLTADEHAFLAASLAERDRRATEERARRARERALERRSLRRLRALAGVLAAAALLAGGLTAVALGLAGQRAEQVRVATARELAAAANANLDVDPERSILLALEAVEATRAADGTVLREAEEALRHAVQRSRVVHTVPQGRRGLAVSADGARFATTGHDGAATVWQTATGDELAVLRGHDGDVNGLAFSPDGQLVATSGDDGTVRLWRADSGEQLSVLGRHDGWSVDVAFSPDGGRLASIGEDAAVRLWDVSSGNELTPLTGHDGGVWGVAFAPDGRRLATAGLDQTVRLWDLDGDGPPAVLDGLEWGAEAVAFSPDGRQVATAGVDGFARTFDAPTGEPLDSLPHPVLLGAVAYGPGGRLLAAGGSDGTTRVWDVDSGRQVLDLPGHAADVTAVAFTPDGDRLLTTSLDGTTRLWDVSAGGARDWVTVPTVDDIYPGVAFSPDGTRFAAPAPTSGVAIWDTATGEEVATLDGSDEDLTTVAFSPDGRLLAAGSDRTAAPPVWDVDSGELRMTLDGHEGSVRAVAFSPDGRHLVTADGSAIRLWEAAAGEVVRTLEPEGRLAPAAAFSADGRLLAAGHTDGRVRVWDADTLEEIHTLDGHTAAVFGIAFGPGDLLATSSLDGTAVLWDLASGEARRALRGHDAPVNQVAVSPDGALVATAGDDSTVRLWDAEAGEEVLTLRGHDLLVFGVAFSPDGRLLATASPDGTVALHILPLGQFVEVARGRLSRALTDDECREYLYVERCPAP